MVRLPTHRAPTHPGEYLRYEFIEPLDLTQVHVAKMLDVPLQRLNEVVRGKRGVTTDTALRLSRLLGTSPEFWISMQLAYDLYQAQHSEAADAIKKIRPLNLNALTGV